MELLPTYEEWLKLDYPKKLKERVIDSYTLLNSFGDMELLYSENDYVTAFMHRWYESEVEEVMHG